MRILAIAHRRDHFVPARYQVRKAILVALLYFAAIMNHRNISTCCTFAERPLPHFVHPPTGRSRRRSSRCQLLAGRSPANILRRHFATSAIRVDDDENSILLDAAVPVLSTTAIRPSIITGALTDYTNGRAFRVDTRTATGDRPHHRALYQVTNPWEQLLPPLSAPSSCDGRGVDVCVSWTMPLAPEKLALVDDSRGSTVSDEVSSAADGCMLKILASSSKIWHRTGGLEHLATMRSELIDSMNLFTQFCLHHLQKREQGQQETHNKHPQSSLPSSVTLSLRIVSSRGTAAGTKCPLWHVDHVPVRWIQALVGPGCEYVADSLHDVQWENWRSFSTPIRDNEHLHDDEEESDASECDALLSVNKRNEQLVRKGATIERCNVRGNRYDAVLLPGLEQSALFSCSVDSPDRAGRLSDRPKTGNVSPGGPIPIVHRSPAMRVPWQGRVLLTMNIHLG
jgi:Protein of unknown function (DUF1826)